ncbi:response regulator [Cohnella fermenti]|uniref:Response regulator n=1 Tax=Cohnella fermenti TaxID=2565925 RepID=A0A4V3WFZ0_9BACL|nr:response regulator [Cohnella fermenti]THF82242.1 response regulator [Cohnella fermenti]
MNVLIVEDELLIRGSIAELLRQSGFERVTEAEDGFKAVEALRRDRFDLVLSDINMPGMNGLELLAYIREQFGDTLFIVLSGYDLFEYAQKAVKLGAFAYLLKPIKDADIQAVIAQAMQELAKKRAMHEQEVAIQIKLKQGTLALRRLFIAELMTKKADAALIRDQIAQYDFSPPHNGFASVLVGMEETHTAGQRLTRNDSELVRYAVENICLEMLENSGYAVYPFQVDDGLGLLVNGLSTEDNPLSARLVPDLSRIRAQAYSYVRIGLSAGIGETTESLARLPHSFATAKRAFARKLVSGEGVYAYRRSEADLSEKPELGSEAEQQLTVCLDRSGGDSAHRFIDSQFAFFYTGTDYDLNDMKQFNYRLILLIQRALRRVDLDPDHAIGEQFALYAEVGSLRRLDDIVAWFHRLIDLSLAAWNDKPTNATHKLMEKARDFVNEEFSPDMSLTLAAERLGISPEYLSREFKRAFGENFSNFVLRVKLEKAKGYLRSSTCRIQEVAQLVGFNDEKYFAKTFKMNTGLTPGEFRASKRQPQSPT